MKDPVVASTLPLWFQLAAMVVGPLLTYLGITYKERSNLRKIAEDSVANTITGQDAKLDKLDNRLELAEAKVDSLSGAYKRIRNSIIVIQAQAESIRIRFSTYLDLVDTSPERAAHHMKLVNESFDKLFETITSLLEETDPLEAKTRQPNRETQPTAKIPEPEKEETPK